MAVDEFGNWIPGTPQEMVGTGAGVPPGPASNPPIYDPNQIKTTTIGGGTTTPPENTSGGVTYDLLTDQSGDALYDYNNQPQELQDVETLKSTSTGGPVEYKTKYVQRILDGPMPYEWKKAAIVQQGYSELEAINIINGLSPDGSSGGGGSTSSSGGNLGDNQYSTLTPEQNEYLQGIISGMPPGMQQGIISGLAGLATDNTFDERIAPGDITGVQSLANFSGYNPQNVGPFNYGNAFDQLGSGDDFYSAVDAADRRAADRAVRDARASGGNELHSRGLQADIRDIENSLLDRTARRQEERFTRERGLELGSIQDMLNRQAAGFDTRTSNDTIRQGNAANQAANIYTSQIGERGDRINDANDSTIQSFLANQGAAANQLGSKAGIYGQLQQMLGLPLGVNAVENVFTPEQQSLFSGPLGDFLSTIGINL